MIFLAPVRLLTALCRAVFQFSPTLTISWLQDSSTAAAFHIGAWAGVWDKLFPVIDLLSILYWLLATVFPIVSVYVVANWVWRHLPQIAGVGPGSG